MNDAKELLGGLKKSTAGISKSTSGLKGMLSELKNSAKLSADKINGSFKTIAKTAATVFGTYQLNQFGRQCIEASSDLQEVQNIVDTVFGSMSSSIDEWAVNAKKQFGLSELSAKKFSSTMGAMLKSSGVYGNDMKIMSLNLSALAADMASFYNISSSTAFSKIRAGISGEIEPLKQLGINMSVANMEAYALSQGITKSYNAMSQAEQSILRYNYLMSVTKDAQGDFARTSNSWANQTKIFTETINQLKSNIGALLIQAFTPFLQMLNKIASKLVEVSGAIKNVFGLKSSSEQVSGGLSSAADSATDVAGGLSDANKELQKLKTAVAGFDELNILQPNTESLSDASDNIANMDISNPYAGAFDEVAQNIDKLDQKTQAMIDKVIEKLRPVAEAVNLIKDTWSSAWENGNGERVIGSIKQYLNATLDLIHNVGIAFKEAWNSNNTGIDFVSKIQNGLANIIGLAASVKQSIADAFATNSGVELIQSVIEYFGMLIDIVSAFAEGLRSAWDNAGAGTELIQSIMDTFSSLLGVITTIGEAIAETFRNDHGQAMFSALIELGKTLLGIISSIADAFSKAWNENNLGKEILNNIADIITNIVSGVQTLGENFKKAWESNETGKQIIQTLLEMVEKITERVKQAANVFKEWAQGVNFEPLLDSLIPLSEAFSELAQVIADKLASVFETVLLPFAEWSIEAGLPALIESLASAFEWLANTLAKIPPETLVKLAAGFGGLKLAISGISIALGALSGLANIIQIFSTIGNALSGLVKAAEAVPTALGTVGDAISTTASSCGGVAQLLFNIGTGFAAIAGAALLVAPALYDFEGFWNSTISNIQDGVESLKRIPETLKSSFSNGLFDTTLFDTLKQALTSANTDAQTAFDGMSQSSNNAAQNMSNAFQSFQQRTKTFFDAAANDAVGAFEKMGSSCVEKTSSITGAFADIKARTSEIMAGLNGDTKENFSSIKTDGEGTAESISTGFSDASEKSQSAFEMLRSKTKSVFDDIKQMCSDMNSEIKETQNNLDKLNGSTGNSSTSKSSAASASTFSLSPPSIPELAGGGVLRRATTVIAGEYPGAYNNPEIVTPQKLLQQIVTKANENMAADIVSGLAGIIAQRDEATAQTLTTSISGNDLLFVVEQARKKKGTTLSKNFAFGGR